jgi:hypothetical protein
VSRAAAWSAWICPALLGLALAGCEHSQADAARLKKADAKASQGAAKAYTAGGWTPGDDASWQNEIRARTQGQNEYARIPAMPDAGSNGSAAAVAASAPAKGG